MFCMYCGKPNEDGSRFCSYCGKAIGEQIKSVSDIKSPDVQENQNQTTMLLVSLIINLVLGAGALIWSLITYANDTSSYFGYTYKSPLTTHEVMVITIGIGGLIIILGGLLNFSIRMAKYSGK